jgi:glycosyltransferase involved in cell wall biosynthesis
MRIGIVPWPERSDGGIYQYSLMMLTALREWKVSGCIDDFVVFADPSLRNSAEVFLNSPGWEIQSLLPNNTLSLPFNIARRLLGNGALIQALRSLRVRLQRHTNPVEKTEPLDTIQFHPRMSRWFRQCGVELMLYAAPQQLAFEVDIPYVMAIHDLQHRLQPEFPEVSANGEWEAREYLFRNAARYATILLADSEVGKEDILNFYGCYGIHSDQVKVLRFVPSGYLFDAPDKDERQRIRQQYKLPKSYLFYPAQFWPHKNHRRIVEALGELKRRFDLKIPIVFCGSHTGDIREYTFAEVVSVASQMGLDEEVWYLGYIPDKHMAALYSDAVALIMPTFFGPTNIPILEAWSLDCPVLTSDIRGVREQAGQAAVLVNPSSVESIADGIHKLWTDEALRLSLIKRGRERLADFTSDDFRQRLISVVEEAKMRVILKRRQPVQQSPVRSEQW